MAYKIRAYIAGPFFNKSQLAIVEKTKSILEDMQISYFSPKDESLYTPENEITSEEVFKGNVEAIHSCDIMVAITDGKDVGTMFEAGYAFHCGIPIVYLWINHQRRPFNIMLAESGAFVAYGYLDLRRGLAQFITQGSWPEVTLKGVLE
jgi:nucleoside 2-deoxyribosyltransferase